MIWLWYMISSCHPSIHPLSSTIISTHVLFTHYILWLLILTGTDAIIIIVFVRIPITHIIPPFASYKTSKLQRMPTTTINPLKRKVHNTTYVKLTHLGRAIHSTRHEWLHYGSATFFIRVVGGTNSSSSSIVSCCCCCCQTTTIFLFSRRQAFDQPTWNFVARGSRFNNLYKNSI